MNTSDILSDTEQLVQRELRASAPPRAITRRHALTLWSGDGLGSAVVTATPLLLEARPAVVQLHAGPQGLRDGLRAAALRVRATVPGVALWVGVAWDGWVDEVTPATVERVVERVYLPAARAAYAVGAQLLVINSEAAGKVHPAAARLLAVTAIDRIRGECPLLALGHTAYDHPHYHPEERNNGGRVDRDEEGYPWSAFLGGEAARKAGVAMPRTGPVDLELPQQYAAPAAVDGRQPIAGLGSLQRRIAGSKASYARAAALGWIDRAVPVLSYVQAHHVDARDTAAVGATEPLALWAAPTRLDDDGRRALRVLCAAERGELGETVLIGADARVVTAWMQGRVGAAGDGAWGAKSTTAAAAWLRARGLDGDGRLDGALLTALQR